MSPDRRFTVTFSTTAGSQIRKPLHREPDKRWLDTSTNVLKLQYDCHDAGMLPSNRLFDRITSTREGTPG
jgi:hypothetical protein